MEWPVPAGVPLYAPIEKAAEIAGVSQNTMRAWANDQGDPLPQLAVGKKRLVRVGALPEYMERRELK
ncbi:helix-turn-helix domain-containing protein [Parvibacter caecicola]|uniref:helix-turn-helix domain-containing protein n=1 Tax=Parvibacter caecicola TaxID=747645 RepID=UPI00272F13F3|nr:helix-turn-helix domain-containing protein [Parvibacter caecicola]